QRRREGAERVRQRGSLRHGGHRHPNAHGRTENSTEQESDDDPGVADDLEMHERADDRQGHADIGEVHDALGGLGMAQELQPQDEENRGEQVAEFDEVSLPVHKNRSLCFGLWTLSYCQTSLVSLKRFLRRTSKTKVQSPKIIFF